MSKSRTSHPITGDIALIDRHGEPGGETITAPESTTASSKDGAQYAIYSEWADAARPYFETRASQPGAFTTFDALTAAPLNVREPGNAHWAGRLTVELHDEGVIDYALDAHGTERWAKSRRPKTAKSGVRVWVGTAAKTVAL